MKSFAANVFTDWVVRCGAFASEMDARRFKVNSEKQQKVLDSTVNSSESIEQQASISSSFSVPSSILPESLADIGQGSF